MKRHRNQKIIFTLFNQRVTGASFGERSSIGAEEQIHGDNLFTVDTEKLKVLDDLNHPLSGVFDTEEKLDNKVDRVSGVRLSANFHNYGKVLIETYEEFPLIIFNESEMSLTLEEITGLPANGFTLRHPPVLPVTIPPKGSQFLQVLFIPEAEGEKTAILSLTLGNRQRHTLQVILTGTAIKLYFFVGEIQQGRGFRKMIGWAKLGRGEVCPGCKIGEVKRLAPHIWMRLIPRAGHFACRKCGTRFLTIYKWGKVLFQGQNIRR
jgi:hypothetical protein